MGGKEERVSEVGEREERVSEVGEMGRREEGERE